MIFSVSIEVYDAISTGGTITNKNEYDIKTFFRSLSSTYKCNFLGADNKQ